MSQPAIARRTVTVTSENGLHMVPCSEIAKFVRDFPGQVLIHKDHYAADARSILDLLQLKAECGTTLILEAQGESADLVVDGLAQLFASNFEVPRSPPPPPARQP
jgi:phosphotransferase system HPr (HPr) family protein